MAETFYRLAQAFELLAIALDDCDNPQDRKGLLREMSVVIDEIDELLRGEAADSKRKASERINIDIELEKLLKSASKMRASVNP